MPPESVAPPTDGFALGRRGYDPQQVDAHLRRLDAEVRILVADRDAAVDQAAQLGRELDEARLRAERLRTQVRTMAGRPSDVQGMSERMRTMLRLAEDEVADMLRRADGEVARRLSEADANAEQVRGAAQREAAQLLDSARSEVENTTGAAARRRAETDAACAAERQTLADERAALNRDIARAVEEAEQERSRLWAESETRRTLVEEDFSLAMDQRRAEALSDVHAERTRTVEWVRHSRDETTRQCRVELAAAEETARGIIAAAQERMAEMADLRSRIAAQLHGTQTQLLDVLAELTPGREPASARIAAPPAAEQIVAPPLPEPVMAAEPLPALPVPEPTPALPAASNGRNDIRSDKPATDRTEAVDTTAARPEVVEPATGPLPVTPAASHTLVLAVPPTDVPGPEAPTVPGQAGQSPPVADRPAPSPAEPEQLAADEVNATPTHPLTDDDPRRPHARRRDRRPATGATRR